MSIGLRSFLVGEHTFLADVSMSARDVVEARTKNRIPNKMALSLRKNTIIYVICQKTFILFILY